MEAREQMAVQKDWYSEPDMTENEAKSNTTRKSTKKGWAAWLEVAQDKDNREKS